MTKTKIKENKSEDIKELRKSDFSITKFEKDLSYGKKHEKMVMKSLEKYELKTCLLYTSPSPRDLSTSRMPSSA